MPSENNRKRMIHAVSWFAAVGALTGYCIYYPDAWQRVRETPLSLLILLSLLGCATWFVVYLQSYASLKAVSRPPPFLEYLAVFCVSLLINYTPVRFGIAARAAYLARVQKVGLAAFTAITTFRLLVLLFVAGSLASASLILLQTITATNLVLLAFFVLCAGIPVVVLVCAKLDWWPRLPGFLGTWINRFQESFRRLADQNQLKPVLCTLICVQFFLVACRMKLCFSHAEMDLGLLEMMILAPTGAILSVLAITPGGIGVREFAVASICALLNFSFEQGMQAMIIDRISMIFVAILLGFGGLPKFLNCWQDRSSV